ncbi:Fanconi anemia group I protein-like [Lingula anatina]|uniref:Fanconi anemia group I protein-like n=1 Tax=Lingula anatina TaxID=7574 RepID=A0A1S3KHQ1_LINAN|nr:Fanconi anemia group I protein-like [Lingula anatina]|eukprot:XP_013422004.1 Fanconi anemia group I protein-like [Lingula anatina]
MDKKILSLFDEGTVAPLTELLTGISENELTSLINNRALRGKGDPVALVRAILYGSPCISTDNVQRRLLVYKVCIGLLQGNEIQSKVAAELVGLLMLEVDNFPGRSLAELAGDYVDSIKNGTASGGKSLELFPKVLSAIASQEVIAYAGNEVKGPEYKSHILNTMCASKWDPKSVIPLATIFRDIPVTSDELQFLINKIMRMFKDVDFDELPPLVYQLLLLSTKGHKRLVLEGISKFFIKQDKISEQKRIGQKDVIDLLEDDSMTVDQLRQTEGNIILHITFATKQDQELGREFIKYLKSNQQCSSGEVLAPFNLALALSIARIHRFEEQIYDFLKAAILRSFKDRERQQESWWVREMVPVNADVAEMVLQTVKNSVFGWDHVTQGLVQLGFTLMDAYGPKSAFGKMEVKAQCSHVTPSQNACNLGAKMLLETFKAHEVVRGEILEEILNRVITKATAPVSHFLDLLSATVRSAPQILLESLPKVREAFDYLSFLPASTALGLLKAVQPLLKLSVTLKDALLLVLRKAMFSRQIESRRIAVGGFLLVLKHFNVLGGLPSSQCSQEISSSQVHVEVHSRFNQSGNEALCLEILGNLRRCLTQQADVRLNLYEGLYEVQCRNTKLGQPILEMLLSQLKRYYESAVDVNPPLKLDLCIQAQGDQVFLTEPLAHLIACIQQCVCKVSEVRGQDEEEEEDGGAESQLEDMLESITCRMIKSEMEDFELDKSADFSLTSGVGVKNNIFAILVLGVYEVLIEYSFSTGDYGVKKFEDVIRLYQNYHTLSEVLKTAAGAGKKGKGAGTKTARSLLTMRFAVQMLKALYSDSIPSHQESLAILRQNTDFVKFVVNVAMQKLQQINDQGKCDGVEGENKEKLFTYCCTMARVFLQESTTYLESPGRENKKEKGRRLSDMHLEAFATIVNIICTRYEENLPEFLRAIDINLAGDAEDMDEEDLMYMHCKKIQRLVMCVIEAGDEDDRSVKDIIPLINILGQLGKHLKPDREQFTQFRSWINRLCAEQNIDDVSVVKVLLSLQFKILCHVEALPSLIRDFSQDIHSQLGDIDQEVEVEKRTHYAIVNQHTAAPCVLNLVLHQIESELDHTDWVISRLKAELQASVDSSAGLTQRESLEKNVCGRLGVFITAFHELVQSAVPPGGCVEGLLKEITKMYEVLAALTKFYLSMYTQRAGHMSARFEKLVKLSGTYLTQQVYAMITFIQASQAEQLQQGGPKKDKKKNGSASVQVGKARVLKESKFIPNLIFSIEQYEKFLIQLTKKSKVNLMEHIKLTTSRDFRINTAALETAMEHQSSSDNDTEEENTPSEEDEENEPPNKKTKVIKEDGQAKKPKLSKLSRGKKVVKHSS